MSAEMKPAQEMVTIEVDGVELQAPKGSMIIEATDRAGIDIPRFCYHRKLTIAANCRMCLVDVEKAPKPLPACATPVMEGMKVYTESRRAIDAQHGVMEFLLINHPLDCPICDQGGECELQDLAMGYGRSVSRFTERKRVVKDKDVGPLVQTDMTRCIHCTRCVRFLEEIAGTCEMGGAGRGDSMEIGTVVQSSIDSELSGNIIDLCPVGALTDKPFRFSARAWELTAKPSLASHDGVVSLLYHHSLRGRIRRTVPRENEPTNEAWLADRDRYSVTGLYSEDRLLKPSVKLNGEWKETSWDEALDAAAKCLKGRGEDLGVLMSPSVATEDYYLAQKLARGLGCDNIDHRLREADFSDDSWRVAAPAFATPIAGIDSAGAILLVGCNIRHEAPILGHRVRKAWKAGAKISAINPLDWPFVFDTETNLAVAPQQMQGELACVAVAAGKLAGKRKPAWFSKLVGKASPTDDHKRIAQSLADADTSLVFIGQAALSHGQAASIRALAGYIAETCNANLNIVSHGANAVGAWRAGAVPHCAVGVERAGDSGLSASAMLAEPRQAYLLWGAEPDFDIENPARAMAALRQADKVVAVTDFATGSLRDSADVLLPLAPIAESEGTLFNFDGEALPFTPAVRASGDAKPGWKILRKLGEKLGLDGFAQINLAEVQSEMAAAIASTKHRAGKVALGPPAESKGLFRVGEIPLYSTDALCRRATPLQATVHADSAFIGLNPEDAADLGLEEGDKARAKQASSAGASVELAVRLSPRVPVGAVWLRSGTCSTIPLGAAMGEITVEKAG